jgi:hypothetical protein
LSSFVLSFFRSFVLSFFHSFILSFFRSFVLSFFRSFILSFFLSFIHSFVRVFARSFARSLVRSLVRSFVRSFVCSFGRLRTRPFVHLFVGPFVHCHHQYAPGAVEGQPSKFVVYESLLPYTRPDFMRGGDMGWLRTVGCVRVLVLVRVRVRVRERLACLCWQLNIRSHPSHTLELARRTLLFQHRGTSVYFGDSHACAVSRFIMHPPPAPTHLLLVTHSPLSASFFVLLASVQSYWLWWDGSL